MMRQLRVAVLVLALVVGVPLVAVAQDAGKPVGSGAADPAGDKVVKVESEDAEVNAAIAKARASLAQFWAMKEKPADDVEGFALKVKIQDGDRIEHFWLVDVARDGEAYQGTINNIPNTVGNVAIGGRHRFAEADITDWMFMRGGKIVGNETMRPLLKQLPPEQADHFRRMLETP